MANEWFTATSQYYLKDLIRTWDESNKYKTLSEELGFDVNTGNNVLSAWTANGWQRGFFDDFDTTPVGQQPANVVAEPLPRVGSAPEWWWAMGRGPTGNGASVEPGFTRADFSTNLYQIRAPSVMGLGTVRLPTVPNVGNGVIYSTSMQTERRGPNRTIIGDPAVWAAGNNMSYSQSYGFFECRMRAPRYAGSWPGPWLISADEYTASTYPRIELDIAEVYLTSVNEDGNVHITPWLHRPQSSAWIAPGGFSQQDTLWSSGGVDTRMYYNQGAGAVKKFDDGFHTYGVYLKKDLSAPNGLGWWIWYLDREEIARIPLITEWLRYYYLIVSHQIQQPYASNGYTSAADGTIPGMAAYDVKWLEVDYWGAWRNPAVVDPPHLVNYVPPALSATIPTKTISLGRLERAMSVKSDVKVAGNILTPEHSSADIPPTMAMQANFTIVEGDPAGTVVGTVAITNPLTVTNPVKYRLIGTDADHFAIDAQTGDITTVFTPLVIRDYDLYVIASDTPLTPKIPGSNTTHVLISCKEDAIFGFEYWRGGPYADPVITDLQWWLDAQDPTVTTETSGFVTRIDDKSNRNVYREQTDLTKCPVLNPTGINGFPAWETQNANVLMAGPEVISATAMAAVLLTSSGKLSVTQGGATPINQYNFVDPGGILCMSWRADPATNPDAVLMSHNGTMLTPFAVSPANKVYTVAVAMVYKADGINATNIGTIHTGLHLFNQADQLARWFDGKLGEIGVMYWPANEGLSLDLHEKLVGGLAHKWGLTSLLPADHPWKVTVPKLWRTSVTPGGWPDAASTGCSGTLTAYTGSYTVDTDDIVIENKIFNDQLDMTGANQVIRNCRHDGGGNFGIRGADATNLLVEDCTFTGPGGGVNAALTINGTARRNNISGYENGIIVEPVGPSIISRNYIHDLTALDAGHIDGISVQGGQDDVLIEDNHIIASGTSAIFIKSDYDDINDVTVNHNLCKNQPGTGGYAFPIYDYQGSGGVTTNIRITNNVMEPGDTAPFFGLSGSTAVISGNTDTNGNPVSA